MKQLLFIVAVLLACSCKDAATTEREAKEEAMAQADSIKKSIWEKNSVSLELQQPTVVVVEFDSLEIEAYKSDVGEENFYTGADDLMYYDAMMRTKMQSLNIPVVNTEKDVVYINKDTDTITIVKDTTFSLYSYFYFDGEKLIRTDVMDLLDQ